MQGFTDIFRRLQQRSVIRAAIAHIIFFWVLVQVADVVLPYIGIVDDAVRWAFVAGIALFPVTLIIAWCFEQPWTKYTGSRLAIDALVIAAIAITAGGWALRNLPQVLHTKTSIVILPFEHTGEPLEQSVSRALAYEINSLLMKSKSIDVIGFQSATSLVLAGMGTTAVANRLRVAHVLSGTVKVANNTMHIDLQLSDSAGLALWDSVIESRLENLFSVQEDIAISIESRLGAGENTVPVKTVAAQRCWMPTDPAALERYYTARYYIELRTDSEISRTQISSAIELYEKLVEQYPNFADAQSALAWALMLQVTYDPENAMPEPDRSERVERLAETALAECPTLGEAMHLLPNEYDHPNGWIGDHQQLTAFLEMQPDRPEYYQRLSRHYRDTGLIERAVEVAEKNYALNPLSPRAIKDLSVTYQYIERFDEAIELADLAQELGNTGPNFARWAKRNAACKDDLECILSTLPPRLRSGEVQLRTIFSTLTDNRAAIDLALSLHAEQPDSWVNLFNASACWFDQLTPLFFEVWEQNREVGGYWYWPNVWMNGCDNVWAAEEFPAFVEEVGLVEYWQAVGWPAMCRAEGDGVVCGIVKSPNN